MDAQTADKPKAPLWKRVLLISLEVILMAAFLFYWILKSEGIDLGLIPLAIIFGLVVYLHKKNFGTLISSKRKHKSFRLSSSDNSDDKV